MTLKTVPESYPSATVPSTRLRRCARRRLTVLDDGAKTALKALASFEPSVKPDRIVLAKTYTNDFARRAKEKFKA
jgi:NitT/TauT family transport system substrate-binding protein